MAEVFISYKSERRSAAQHLARVIELYGYSVWFDYWLISGKDFGRQIERELTEAKAVVVLWCPLSRESEWVLEEAHLAQRHGKLAPAWLERVDPPLGFGRADTIDLTDWTGAPRGGHGFDRLLDELARMVGRRPVMPGWKEVRDYEATWRNFGALRLAQFPLINPLREREDARGLDEKARREEEERVAEERRKAAEALVQRLEAERRKVEEAEARQVEEEQRKADQARRHQFETEAARRAAEDAVRRDTNTEQKTKHGLENFNTSVSNGILATVVLTVFGGWLWMEASAERPPAKNVVVEQKLPIQGAIEPSNEIGSTQSSSFEQPQVAANIETSAKNSPLKSSISPSVAQAAEMQFITGLMYEQGLNVPQDYAKAMSYYREAADMGHAKAQYNVGWLYETGNGLRSKDLVQAKIWYRKAAAQGHEIAKAALERLTNTDPPLTDQDRLNSMLSGTKPSRRR